MTVTQPEVRPLQDPAAQLERALIDEFLRARGCDSDTLNALPEAQSKHLFEEASTYAAGKLAEIEARANFVQEIHAGE